MIPTTNVNMPVSFPDNHLPQSESSSNRSRSIANHNTEEPFLHQSSLTAENFTLIKKSSYASFAEDVDSETLSLILYSQGLISTNEIWEIIQKDDQEQKNTCMISILEKQFNHHNKSQRKKLATALYEQGKRI